MRDSKLTICCLNGKFVPEKNAHVPIIDHGFLYSDGFYDTMKAFDGKILDLNLHSARIQRSLRKLSLNLPWSISTVLSWAKKTALLNKLPLARIRLTITRGINHFDFNTSEKPTLVITAEPIRINKAIYEKGVSAFTLPMTRILPEVKTIGVTGMIVARRLLSAKKTFEALFISNGFVREGSITNLFIVKNSRIYTPKTHILKGITRHKVIQIAQKEGFKVIRQDMTRSELLKADEAFLTNTKFGVVPLVSVDDKKIGKGNVGKITRHIMAAFNEYVVSYLRTH